MWPAASPPTTTAIRHAFGVDVGELTPAAGGWGADAFTDGRWFVKVYRHEPPARLDVMEQVAAHGVPVPAPLRTVDGGELVAWTDDGRPCAVFPFVAGRTGTLDDHLELAKVMRAVHAIEGIDVPLGDVDESAIDELRERYDHPWISDRRDEVAMHVDRLEATIERTRAIEVPRVVCHRDLLPHNVLVGDDGRVAAVLDWDSVALAPREHDLFACFDGPDPAAYLQTYGAAGLDLTHLEYALLARGVRDLTARIVSETDRDGVDTWGFARLRRVDADLAQASRFS